MNTETPNLLTTLLNRYYEAEETTARRLEDEILACIAGFVRKQLSRERFLHEDSEDLYVTAMTHISVGLRDSRRDARRIHSFVSWARTVISRVIIEERRRNTPRRKMTLRVLYIVTTSRRKGDFARWQLLTAWWIGLKSWEGRQYEATERYTSFCQDDTRFFQHALGGRNPADPGQIELWELLLQFLKWIGTPLEQEPLVKHLLKMQPITVPETVYLEDLTPSRNGDAGGMAMTSLYREEAQLNWEICWNTICELSPQVRAALLLTMDPALLVVLTSQADPRPLLAQLMDVSLEEIEALWQMLPLSDEEIAHRFDTNVGNIHTMRSRCRDRIEKRAGFPLPL